MYKVLGKIYYYKFFYRLPGKRVSGVSPVLRQVRECRAVSSRAPADWWEVSVIARVIARARVSLLLALNHCSR
jgi:hypothetical protein